MQVLERYGVSPVQAWLGALVTGILALVAGATLFPRAVYDGFIWRYFWGPVHADARAADCAYRLSDGSVSLGRNLVDDLGLQENGCDPALVQNAVYATPGYTMVSTVGYMVVLVFMLVGVYFLLRRLDLQPYKEFFFALVPFMLFGGALRVVEDATDAAVDAGLEPAVDYPLNTVLISPVIYGTVFVFALVALLFAKWLHQREITDTYHYPLGAIGVGALLLTIAHLTNLALTREYVAFHPGVLLTVAILSVLIAVGVYAGAERWAPSINSGTGLVGLAVVWGHAVDGVANVLASDWTHLFGIDLTYGSKHVFNRFVIDVTRTVQPEWLTAAVGDSWPFLVVKIAVATAILALFDEEFMAENPRYSIMLLGAIVAVGLGPGTRDVLRVTFGI